MPELDDARQLSAGRQPQRTRGRVLVRAPLLDEVRDSTDGASPDVFAAAFSGWPWADETPHLQLVQKSPPTIGRDRPSVVDGPTPTAMPRGVRPGRLAWDHEMRWLARVHEIELRLPDDVVDDVAVRLGVTVRSVLGRFGEYARTITRVSHGDLEPAALAAAVLASDFRSAATILRAAGTNLPSLAIEHLLVVAPGPAAARLRARESVRRTGQPALRQRSAA